jgi:hypothetical protein
MGEIFPRKIARQDVFADPTRLSAIPGEMKGPVNRSNGIFEDEMTKQTGHHRRP